MGMIIAYGGVKLAAWLNERKGVWAGLLVFAAVFAPKNLFGSPFFIIPGFARNISSNTLRVQKQVKQHIYHVWNAGQPRFFLLLWY